MVVYENAALWSKKEGFFEKGSYDTDNEVDQNRIQGIANATGNSVYLIREFIVVDAEYQEQPPSKCAKDWFVKEYKSGM